MSEIQKQNVAEDQDNEWADSNIEDAEITPDDGHLAVRMLERTHAAETFGTAEGRAAFLRDNSPEQLEDYMNRLNGWVRGLKQSERIMDGLGHISMVSGMVIGDYDHTSTQHNYEPPVHTDRKPLMHEAFQAAKEIDDPERAATMLGLVTNAVHPYMDGNGRTTRVSYSLLTRGYDASFEDNAYYDGLLENGSRGTVNLDPTLMSMPYRYSLQAVKGLVKEHGYNGPVPKVARGGYTRLGADGITERSADDQLEAKDLMVGEHVSEAGRKILHDIATDEHFDTPIMMQYVLENLTNPAEYMKEYSSGLVAIDQDKLMPTLNDAAISRLQEIQHENKREYVRSMIDLFKNGPEGGFADTMVDYYRPKDDVEPLEVRQPIFS